MHLTSYLALMFFLNQACLVINICYSVHVTSITTAKHTHNDIRLFNLLTAEDIKFLSVTERDETLKLTNYIPIKIK